jgi:hypothetical protein
LEEAAIIEETAEEEDNNIDEVAKDLGQVVTSFGDKNDNEDNDKNN